MIRGISRITFLGKIKNSFLRREIRGGQRTKINFLTIKRRIKIVMVVGILGSINIIDLSSTNRTSENRITFPIAAIVIENDDVS